jgi:[ribosomal protein S18]-alanine N-acetyltransferase
VTAIGRVPPGRLRVATPSDAVTCAAIDAATSTQPWSATTFAEELGRPDRHYRVAVGEGGEVVGYGGIAVLAGDAHVMGLAVLPAARGRGWGGTLLTALVAAARAAGCGGVTLEVRPANSVARRLYRRAGFAVAGRRSGYYPDGEDALILWLDDLTGGP